jgi:hypothetical protein
LQLSSLANPLVGLGNKHFFPDHQSERRSLKERFREYIDITGKGKCILYIHKNNCNIFILYVFSAEDGAAGSYNTLTSQKTIYILEII